MTQISSGLNLPQLSKTESSKKIEKKSLVRFLAPTNLQIKGEPTSLTIFWEHGEKRESVATVLDRLAEMELPGKANLQCYLLDMNRRNCKQKSLLEALNSLKLFLRFLRSTGKTRLEEVTKEEL